MPKDFALNKWMQIVEPPTTPSASPHNTLIPAYVPPPSPPPPPPPPPSFEDDPYGWIDRETKKACGELRRQVESCRLDIQRAVRKVFGK